MTAQLVREASLSLDAEEQDAMNDLLVFMEKMNAMGLRANRAEMVAAIHVLQGFVIQHMLGRLDPEHWNSWFEVSAT